ncbi:universal stress protein [Cellulomonas massiliensis]|uniref:universal stress protein n=1 Tax=Cellulomonas massiliensis TaxID=1465811 RepID=UPI0002D47340|nr:universal stress protein [Cellulomonas massiliensis]
MRTEGPVVVAVDGSAHSRRTVDWGLAEAERLGAPAVLVRAFQEPYEYTWGWVAAPGGAEVEAKEHLARELERAAAEHPRLDVAMEVLHGPTVPQLRARTAGARMLVTGAGERPSKRIGPVAAHLAAHARCTVAVVRPEPSGGAGARVVVGVDGSVPSVAAARVAAREAELRGVPLLVVHARPTTRAPFGAPMELPALSDSDANDPAHRAAAQLTQRLGEEFAGIAIDLRLVDDEPANAVVGAARDAQLVVVGSRGLGAFAGMLLGSVSTQVARTAHCTTMVVHEG